MQYQMPPELTKEERAMLNELPPLPTPAYGWNVDYYEGWQYIENPSEPCELLLFSEEQMRSYALEAVRLGRERIARDLDGLALLMEAGQNMGPAQSVRNRAAAIRSGKP